MYLSIIPFDKMRVACIITGGFIVAFNVGSFFAGLGLCSPIEYHWDQTIPGGHCGSQGNYYYAMGFINLVVDVVIIIIPMPFLYKLLLPTPQKILAMSMFAIGVWYVFYAALLHPMLERQLLICENQQLARSQLPSTDRSYSHKQTSRTCRTVERRPPCSRAWSQPWLLPWPVSLS